jgi:MFS family permease
VAGVTAAGAPAALRRNRPLAAVLTATIVSATGSRMTLLALPWFVLVTTGSAARMSLVLAVELAPTALIGILSGSVVSRLGARRTMIVGDAARVPLMAAIPLLQAAGVLSFGLLLACTFAIGVFFAPYFSAQRLILPELVGDDERTVAQANAFLEGAQRATGLLGPALAGVLISVIGSANVLYVDAATFLFSFVVLALLVPPRPPLQAGESGGVLAGLRFLLRDPLLGPILGVSLVLNMFGIALSVCLPALAYDDFGHSARVAGVFFAALGAGALAGSVVAVRAVTRFDPLRLAAVSLIAITLPQWLLAAPLPAAAVVVALFASAFPGTLVNAPLLGVITSRTPDALRPKVMTAVITLATLAGPIGLVATGPLLAALGPRPVLGIAAAGMTVAALAFAVVTMRYRPPSRAAEAPAAT